ncbi:TetR/AcrR family transcriptional regulator [Paracoccus sp. (in: a-proteobacteria)]|uniref:TetR/AcrR family transcriptional regulator n=1 Tax=Paracoccus sp. TaxID=267 RepID=UPI003A85BABD
MTAQTSRRHRTAKKIQAAAIRLAVQDGLNNITTEAIAHAAGVSARTFFNYYPYKEAALMGPPPDYPTDAAEAFVQGSGHLGDDLDQLITAHLRRFEDEREMLGHMIRLSVQDPKLKALRNNIGLSRRSQMTVLLRRRMPDQPKGVLDILAAAILAATNAAVEDWALGDDADFLPVARRYLALILPAANLLNRNA